MGNSESRVARRQACRRSFREVRSNQFCGRTKSNCVGDVIGIGPQSPFLAAAAAAAHRFSSMPFLERGHTDITVLDVAATGPLLTQQRLGADAPGALSGAGSADLAAAAALPGVARPGGVPFPDHRRDKDPVPASVEAATSTARWRCSVPSASVARLSVRAYQSPDSLPSWLLEMDPTWELIGTDRADHRTRAAHINRSPGLHFVGAADHGAHHAAPLGG